MEYRVDSRGYVIRSPDGVTVEVCPPKETKFRAAPSPETWAYTVKNRVHYRRSTELEILLLRPEIID